VKFMAFDPPLAPAIAGMSASQAISQAPTAATGHSEPKADRGRISLPREELEDVVLVELQLTARCADVREVAIFGAAGLRSGATWIVASFFPGSFDTERKLETVRNVERDLQSKYDMMLGS
jgi:hypothetical protein